VHRTVFAVEPFLVGGAPSWRAARVRRPVRPACDARPRDPRYLAIVSKAFTKESDDAPAPGPVRRGVAVPEPNYMTPAGARAARSELAAGPDDARARELADHLATAQVLEPPAARDTASLGASVTVEDASGKRTSYQIVGALEADARRGRVFWQSPIGEALYGARIGDEIVLPRGAVEIVAIDYA
jgi:transcription elongation GreA/GreB family factor